MAGKCISSDIVKNIMLPPFALNPIDSHIEYPMIPHMLLNNSINIINIFLKDRMEKRINEAIKKIMRE